MRDRAVDILRANVNSVADISERFIRIAYLREVLDQLKKETEAAAPLDFPLYVIRDGSDRNFNGRVWVRADACPEAHQLALDLTTSHKSWGVDDCGNDANPLVPYVVYITDRYAGRLFLELLGKPGEMLPGMGKTDDDYMKRIHQKAQEK